jgi:hypothetical protein
LTVCIGIASEPTGRLFFAADSLVSNDWTQAEGVRKFHEITRGYHWVAMYEGTPATATDLFKRIEAQLSMTPTEADVKAACRLAYEQLLKERVASRILPAYFANYDKFMSEGRLAFGDKRFNNVQARIRNAWHLDASLLVMGYDLGVNLSGPVKLCLFEVSNAGEIADHSQLGYAAIGSGKDAAEDVLNQVDFFNHARNDDVIVYWLAAAKFTAHKRVNTVGWRNTVIASIDQAAGWSTMFAEDVERLYKQWLKTTQTPPIRAISHIHRAFLPMAQLPRRAEQIAKRRRTG